MEVGKIRRRIMAMFLVVWIITATGQTAFLEAANGSYASNPYPADGALIKGDIVTGNISTALVFVPGANAVEHTGYFSDDYSKVESRAQDANLGPPPYDQLPGYEYTFWVGNPGVPPADETLIRGVTYYWCVDETDSLGTTYPGDIWEFTVWNYKTCCPNPPDGAVVSGPDVLLSWVPGYGAEEHDVYFGTDFNDVNDAVYDHFTPPPEFLSTRSEPNILVTGLSENTWYYWRVDEIIGRDPPDWIPAEFYKGDVWSFTAGSGEAQCYYPEDGAVIPGDIVSGNIVTALIFIPGPTAVEHTGYFSDDYSKVESRAEDAKIPTPFVPLPDPYTYFVPGPGESLIRGQVYYWTVDANDSFGNTFLGAVWEFTIQDFKAFEPSPPNEALLISTTPLLSWLPGFSVEKHDIYIGTSWEDVNDAVYDAFNQPPEFVITRSDPNYQVVTPLPSNTKIYWRVDEVVGRSPPDFIPTEFYKGNVWSFTTVPPVGQTYHVDGVNGDNTNDGLTQETAFKTIQRGINVAEDFDTVLVWPGVYNEEVSFWGDSITVKSAADAAIVETDYGYAFSFFSAEGRDTVLSNFVIRNSQYGIYLINGASPTLRNLTIVDNDFGISAFNGADPDISSCIFWNNYYGDLFRDPIPLQARYSCIEEGGEGEGNISVEPGFVDVNGGDYHLLSERGRYWPAHDVWVLDDVTSPCIDGGDPTIDPSNERMPNGGRINMGAYGNTAYASMSEWPLKHDSNFDGVVDMRDLAGLALEWLETIPVIPGPYVPDLPPAPAPVIIAIGAVSSSSIRMTASEAFDESGVEYYFEALSAGGHDSGWLDEPNYTDVNLVPDTTYCYRVKARDKSANHNETIWSPQVCAVTVVLPDTLPPLPDPMQWDPVTDANGYDGRPLEVLLAPFGPTDYGATMRAIDADDQAPVGVVPSEVEYYFQCQDDSGFDSGWRTVAAYPNEDERRTYTVRIGGSGLAYRFRVKARDASDNMNETDWSDWYPAVYRDPP